MSVLRAVVGLVAGYFAAALLSNVVMSWQGVSDFEGGRGMAAATHRDQARPEVMPVRAGRQPMTAAARVES